uniref:Uncharacterized protein n=1 Tax=Panagrolaimus davidi TaxID=227884 RepID=A0A914Q0C7_9BILA
MDLPTDEYFVLYRLPNDNLEYLNLDDLHVEKEEVDYMQVGDVFKIREGENVTFIFSGSEEEVRARKITMIGQIDVDSEDETEPSANKNERLPTQSNIISINSKLQNIDRRIKRLESHTNSRTTDHEILKGAVVKINGKTRNVGELSIGEFETLLAVNRQRLGPFPTLAGITELQIVEELGPYLTNSFIKMKFGNFVSYLAGFLLEEGTFRISFLPPLGPNLRASKPKHPKRILNCNFKSAFKYFALYFGGCVLTSDFKPLWLDSLRSRFNTKANNLNNKENAKYITFDDLVPPFNDENAF